MTCAPLLNLSLVASLGTPLAPPDATPPERIGWVRACPAKEVRSSRWSIGAETLDRGIADYDGRIRLVGPPKTIAGLRMVEFRREGNSIVAVWRPEGAPVDGDTSRATDMTLSGVAFKEPVLVDLLSGEMRRFPTGSWERQGDAITFRAVPVSDSPILVAAPGSHGSAGSFPRSR